MCANFSRWNSVLPPRIGRGTLMDGGAAAQSFFTRSLRINSVLNILVQLRLGGGFRRGVGLLHDSPTS